MEGKHHATRDNQPSPVHARHTAQVAPDYDGSTHIAGRASGRSRHRPVGMAGFVAGTERRTVVSAQRTAMPQAPRKIDSKTLMDGERTILIEHEGQEYTLRLTRLGKLLLTK